MPRNLPTTMWILALLGRTGIAGAWSTTTRVGFRPVKTKATTRSLFFSHFRLPAQRQRIIGTQPFASITSDSVAGSLLSSTKSNPPETRQVFQPNNRDDDNNLSDNSDYNNKNANPNAAPAKFIPYPFSYRLELDVRIDTLTNRGLGLARVTLTKEQIQGLQDYRESPPQGNKALAQKNRRRQRRRNKAKEDESTPVEIWDDIYYNNEGEDDEEANDEASDVSGHEQQKQKQKQNQWVIMVPSVVPGELVRVRVFRNFNNYSEADLVQVLEPSPDRVTPACVLAGECGGCQLQHMTITLQRQWKTRHVEEALQRYKIMTNTKGEEEEKQQVLVQTCLGTDQVLGYRSKLTPHYSEPSKSRRGERNVDVGERKIQAIGFQRQSSRQVVEVPHCPIATPEVNAAYQKVRQRLLSEPLSSQSRGGTLLLRQANLGDLHVESNHQAFLTTRVKGLKFSYRAGNFFQNNYHVLPLMVDLVVQQATKNVGGGHQKMTHLADCYCGSGLFAVSCAAHFDRVVGIEINQQAIVEAQANAAANNVTNCQFLAAPAENIFRVISDFPRDSTAVVLDPPRKGCSEDFIQQLHEFRPARIVYMSCDPTTQARDAALLIPGGYSITSVQPLDLFPQTRHIECLMILERTDLLVLSQ